MLDVDGFQTCFGSAASAFEIIELAYIHCPLKENFSVTLIKKGFTCISLICRELLCALGRTINTKYKGAIHLSKLTGQNIPVVTRILLLISTILLDQSKPKY